jgi:hypothetical protein
MMPLTWAIVIIVLWLAVICLAVIVLGVLRRVTPHLERMAFREPLRTADQGPAVGSRLPSFAAGHKNGAGVSDARLNNRPGVLLFLSSHCGPCRQLAGDMRKSDLAELASYLTIVTDHDGPDDLGLPASLCIVTQSDDKVSDALGVRATPFAIAVDGDGIVCGKQVANTVTQLANLAASVTSAIVKNAAT